MAKILFFYPNNPLVVNQGNNARAHALLHYFNSRGFTVDFVGIESNEFTDKHREEIQNSELVRDAYLLPKRKNSGLNYLIRTSIVNKINKYPREFQWIYHNQEVYFTKILAKNTYDYVVISYVHAFPLIKNKQALKNAVTIVDTHDFFTSQYGTVDTPHLGNLFTTEMRLLAKFDHIWAISVEEQFVFSQFLPNKSILTIPHGIQDRSQQRLPETSIDLFYVASDNPHNVESAHWFFKEVHPLLPENINITVVGKIQEQIGSYPNVTKIAYAENLDDFYRKSKVTLCPMLSGTGLKIKVVESLAFGIPVVCNERGVDGLSSKVNNGCLVTDDPKEFASYIIQLLDSDEFYNTHKRYAHEFFNATLEASIVFKKLDQFFNPS